MGQKFAARERYRFPNGAMGWRPGGLFDCIGPFAKVEDCPVDGSGLRYTCYATNSPATFFSVPACTRILGKHVSGFFMVDDECVKFVPYSRFDKLIGKADRDMLVNYVKAVRTDESRQA